MMINLKSDAINPPTEAMWHAMQNAKPGWVLDRADENVQQLEALGAALMNKEAAVFLPTGRVACLVALLAFAERGTQIIAESRSHILWCQEWNYSTIAGLAARSVDGVRGAMTPEDIEHAIVETHFGHCPATSLLCLENTHTLSGGACLSIDTTKTLCRVAHDHGVPVFLDGARLLYAAAALEIPPADLAGPADAVMVSLAKGLGAPGGVLLCGVPRMMDRAWEHARILGVASCQFLGPLAAAGVVALETMRDMLTADIVQAHTLGNALNDVPGIRVSTDAIETNVVFADVRATGLTARAFVDALAERDIGAHCATECIVRFTTHYRIREPEVARVLDAVRSIARDESP